MKKVIHPHLVIYDLDGTLIDSVPGIASALNEALLDTIGAQVSEPEMRTWVGNGSLKLVDRALKAKCANDLLVSDNLLERVHQRFLHFYAQHLDDPCPIFDGTLELLQWYNRKGVPQAIATNKPQQFVPALLKNQGIKPFISAIIGGNTLEQKKPHPSPLLTLCAQFHCHPHSALMIGDSSSDAISAQKAGVPCWLLEQGYSQGVDLQQLGAQKVFKDTQELLGYVKAQSAY